MEIGLNIIAAAALLLFWLMAFTIIYHLVRFGVGVQPKRLVAIFIFGSVALSSIAITLYATLDISPLLSLLS